MRASRLISGAVVAALALGLAATAASAKPKPSTDAPTTPPPSTLLGMRAAGRWDSYSFDAVEAWQGKPNAVATIFRSTAVQPVDLVSRLAAVWSESAVPIISLELVESNALIASGGSDDVIDATALAIRSWLAGPDGRYGNDDDRRAYMRLGWEPNGKWYRWSPCSTSGGTAEHYKAMWQRYHDRYARLGIDNTRLAWIFSVNQTDSGTACEMERLYPGNGYVDWVGIDGYTWSVTHLGPADVFGPMLDRLRATAPGRPVAVNEAGAHTLATGGKTQYITDYFAWLAANDIRMSSWFNIDKEKDWAVFGGSGGDETITVGNRTYTAWSAYREAVADPRFVGSDRANRRLLTDTQFLGL